MISTSSLPKGTATDPQEPPTSSTSAATLLIGLQIGSRALTFLANQLLLRYLSPELLGISTQLDVYSMSVLFFAREGLRVAIQRKSGEIQGGPQTQRKTLPKSHVDAETTAGKIQTVVNLAYISICLGFVFTVLLAWLYLKGIEGSAVQDTPYFGVALKMYGVAAMCELLSEPCFVVVQTRSMYKIRARTEAAATLMRCLATCASAAWAFQLNQDLGVLPFAVGQVVYALVLIILYYSSFQGVASQIGFSLMIRPIFSSIFVQSIVKHILTQGDTVLIAALATPAVQGTYALANNYGGLLARLIFQPIEESSQNFFV
ncbi:hypothetical protein GLAREA_10162 [Glarea lozoyensis ATCC 20868]|uniref:Man(5)GlcNAc(2)-PP-dolichol translocation protein RFT1 n=1 Tax=Glarea lozoyensis (strain ATCC 20868 / MF5171) TaxID=1116229 RepID=S3E7Z6_GLAL2|nr:uncharacterized protein GLAREA_10162 [Glarea lozoyensis ATCC 20868]EPE34468.1 hypothetical protein GLAREA_10162 [Glarea lozoyensis ATCC 20868]